LGCSFEGFRKEFFDSCVLIDAQLAHNRVYYVPTPRSQKTKSLEEQGLKQKKCGRGDMIRTCDSYVPNVVLYQAELRPDLSCCLLHGQPIAATTTGCTVNLIIAFYREGTKF